MSSRIRAAPIATKPFVRCASDVVVLACRGSIYSTTATGIAWLLNTERRIDEAPLSERTAMQASRRAAS